MIDVRLFNRTKPAIAHYPTTYVRAFAVQCREGNAEAVEKKKALKIKAIFPKASRNEKSFSTSEHLAV